MPEGVPRCKLSPVNVYYAAMMDDPAILAWVRQHGKLVDPPEYGVSKSWSQLYDLSGAAE